MIVESSVLSPQSGNWGIVVLVFLRDVLSAILAAQLYTSIEVAVFLFNACMTRADITNYLKSVPLRAL